MALSFDGTTKTITLSSGTTTLGVRDLWSRWVDWFLTSDNSKYALAFEQVGGNDIDVSAGTSIPIYAFLQNGWKLKPQEANHTLNVNDGILLVAGGGDPFINTTGSYIVRINYSQPVQAITVATGGGSGGGGLTTEQAEQLTRVDTTVALNLDKKISEVSGGGGGGFVNYEAINSHTTRKVNEAKEEIEKKIGEIPQVSLEKIETSLNEIDSHNSLATEKIINTIKEVETEVCSDIIRKTKEIKEDNITTRNLVRQKTKKLDENVSKLADRQEKTDKMIEDEADEIEASLEEIYKQEADMIEKDLEEQYKMEADEIEKSLTT